MLRNASWWCCSWQYFSDGLWNVFGRKIGRKPAPRELLISQHDSKSTTALSDRWDHNPAISHSAESWREDWPQICELLEKASHLKWLGAVVSTAKSLSLNLLPRLVMICETRVGFGSCSLTSLSLTRVSIWRDELGTRFRSWLTWSSWCRLTFFKSCKLLVDYLA